MYELYLKMVNTIIISTSKPKKTEPHATPTMKGTVLVTATAAMGSEEREESPTANLANVLDELISGVGEERICSMVTT